jgi:chromosome segregation ATPase
MHRPLLLVPSLLLIAMPVLGQSASSDSQTLQSLLAEVRQLRHDLQITTVGAQRAQILIYRVQAQESVVRRMQERVDDARSRLAQVRFEQNNRAATIKQIEEKKGRSESPATEQKDLEDTLTQIKARLEADANKEGEIQATITDAEDRLRMEQAKLGGLQDQLDRVDKTLENSGQQAGSNPH